MLVLALALSACPTDDDDDVEPPRAESDTNLVFDSTLSQGFWSFPFPSNLRVTDEGRPDFRGWPNPGESPLVEQYVEFGVTTMEGFGLNSPTYFAFTDPVELPEWNDEAARRSGECEGSVRIVDVTEGSPDYGSCVPARWRWVHQFNIDPYLAPNMALVAPYWGFPLRSKSTYAVVIVDVQDGRGSWVSGVAPLQSALNGEGNTALRDVYAPLAELLADDPSFGGELGGTEWIAAATVFGTQDAVGELRLLSQRVLADDTFPRWEGELELVPEEDEEHFDQRFDLYDGAYTALNFQRGEIPYSSEGGGFVWEDGQPVPQAEERIPFVIGLPLHGREAPPEGWPVVLHQHGTYGDRWSHMVGGGGLTPAYLAGTRNFLSFSIPQPIHGDRWPDGNDLSRQLYAFNYFNPESGLSMFRQGALDVVSAVRFVRENLGEGGAIAEQFPGLKVNPDAIYFLGHSQGGMTGSLAVPFAPEIKAWALSGAGGGTSIQMMQGENPIVIRDALAAGINAPEGTEFFEMHPVMGLVQALVERVDPLNYGPLWVRESEGPPASVLLTEGVHDSSTPPDSTEALAIAAGLPIALPFLEQDVFGLELRGIDPIQTPYSGNAAHPSGEQVSCGLAQFDSNHFAIFYELDAGLLWANFLYSQVRDGAPGELGGSYP